MFNYAVMALIAFILGMVYGAIIVVRDHALIQELIWRIEDGYRFTVRFNCRCYDIETGEYIGKKLIRFGWFKKDEDEEEEI